MNEKGLHFRSAVPLALSVFCGASEVVGGAAFWARQLELMELS
jgi:hypothetical protein